MIAISDEMTVRELRNIERANPQLPQYVHRLTCRSYSDFVDTLYVDLDSIIGRLVQNRNVLQGSSENAINVSICMQLACYGYEAPFDANNGGHVDIPVSFRNYSWLGEGKKVDSVDNTHLRGGYNQLIDRYATGTNRGDQAGLLIYCFAPNATHVVTKWREHLEELNTATPGYAVNIQACADNANHAFWSQNDHKTSGNPLTIKHIALPMHWAP